MASSLRSRLERIARGLAPAAGRWVIVRASQRGDAPPIERTGPRGENLALNVPDGEGDPMARLTAEQRAAIGPDDRIIAVHHVAEGPGGEVLSDA